MNNISGVEPRKYMVYRLNEINMLFCCSKCLIFGFSNFTSLGIGCLTCYMLLKAVSYLFCFHPV